MNLEQALEKLNLPALPYDQGGTFVDTSEDGVRLRRIYTNDAPADSVDDRMLINIGPSHPAMHGTIRMVVELDGEMIVGLDVIPG